MPAFCAAINCTNKSGKVTNCMDSEGLAMKINCRIKEYCNFEFLLSEPQEHAFHLKQSIFKMFVVTQIFYFVKFYNRDICPARVIRKMQNKWHVLCISELFMSNIRYEHDKCTNILIILYSHSITIFS